MTYVRSLVLAVLTVMFLAVPAMAKNVPGSAAAVQGRVDKAVASNLVNLSIQSAVASSQFTGCQKEFESGQNQRQHYCEWGFSANGEMLYLKDSPNGFSYESRNALGNIMFSRWISPNTVLVGGILFELGHTDTNYNNGKTDYQGLGGVAGIIHKLSPAMELSLFGGVEGLDYDVERSNGLFKGNYGATRLFGDAGIGGQAGDDDLWLVYRGGLRLIQQYNESYHEKSGGVPVFAVDGVDLFTMSLTGDLKLGTTIDTIRPYLQASAMVDLVHDEALGKFGMDGDDEIFTGRLGAGIDAEMMDGLLSFSSGIYLTDHGYKGFDVRIDYSKNF